MNDFFSLLCVIILIVMFETGAITCVKEYHINKNIFYFGLAIVCYSVVCILLHQSFYYSSMGITNLLWSGVSIFAVALAGVLFFKEVIHAHDIFAGIMISAGIMIFKYTN